MGIPIPPDPDEYGEDCLHCYKPGETPLILYAAFGGIQPGELWTDDMPPPPNGVFRLVQTEVDNCKWNYIGDKWIIVYDATHPGPGPGETQLLAYRTLPADTIAFIDWKVPPCGSQFSNDIQGWADHQYFGGAAWIFRLTP